MVLFFCFSLRMLGDGRGERTVCIHVDDMPGQKELVKESEAEAFAEELQREVEFHKAH